MSLCNCFRLFVVSCIVLSFIDTHAAFTLRRPTADNDATDLRREESLLLEVKHDLNSPNGIRTDTHKVTNVSLPSDDVDLTTSQLHTDTMEVSPSDKVMSTEKPIRPNTDITTDATYTEQNTFENKYVQTGVESFEPTTLYLLMQSPTLKIDEEIMSTLKEDIVSKRSSSVSLTSTKSSYILQEPKTLRVSEATKPSWKKYTTIERSRSTTTTPSTSTSGESTSSITLESDGKSETKNPRNSLQNASDIGSLEKLKIELLLTTQRQQLEASGNKFSKLFPSEPTTIDQYVKSTTNNSDEVLTTEANLPSISGENKNTVESKRGGYLDYSGKSTADDVAITTDITHLETNNEKYVSYAKPEVENETDVPYEKTGYRMESQSQLNEDALKEELLKEDVLIDNAENAKRIRDDKSTNSSKDEINNTQDNLNDKLEVKPIDMNSEKNTILYPINSNYKPLKKMTVKPPKVFIRDPDDNSWRNESLSSLGIVFKSKNSSKPFTQVLKNKTESELNKLIEKDVKNETPELRERLQKMAEIRKSKKKKTDSLGNIVYFDYEESVSGEKLKSSKEEIVNETSSLVSGEANSNLGSSEKASDVTTTSLSSTTTTERSILREFNVPTTRTPKKLFNVMEYYDNTEDDDTDYLNMAKIDIKKFSTTKMSSTTPKVRDWTRPMIFDRQTPNIPPERKGTVQYFPPLTTQKVNINDYDTDFKYKVNSFTTVSEQPKNVIPVSTPDPTKKTHGTIIQYNKYKNQAQESTPVPQKNYGKDFYLTRPPFTTELFTLPGDGRDGYGINHYRDFINQAAKDEEYDKNIDYGFITQAPIQGVTKTEINTYEKNKSRLNTADEYDYETQFRKDVLQRFVENFNRNTHRFKSDFPILFNNSVIHSDTNSGRDMASSRSFMRGLYETKSRSKSRPCDPHCDVTVELSPAYELHYYVPEQEERQEAPPPTITYHN